MYLITIFLSFALVSCVYTIPTNLNKRTDFTETAIDKQSKPGLLYTDVEAASILPSVRKPGGGGGSSGRPSGGSSSRPKPKPRPKPFHSGSDGDDFDGEEPEDTCFPASALVHLENGKLINLSSLRVGDRVRLADGTYSPVFMFGHRVTNGNFEFLSVRTETGHITLSSGHFIYANGQLVAARELHVGDALEKENGVRETVQSIDRIVETGLYNPMTVAGEILVNGFRASVYTETVVPEVGNALLAPLRAAFGVWGGDVSLGCLENHAGQFARYARMWIGRTVTSV